MPTTGDEEYYLAGQPVAQDTFGAAMFKQMAISRAGGVPADLPADALLLPQCRAWSRRR